jgi:hypothetical protein
VLGRDRVGELIMGLGRWSTTAVAAFVLGVGVFAGPQAAAADNLLVLDNCVATVPAGKQIALLPSAVTAPIVDRLTPLDPLNVLTPAFRVAWATEPPITLPGGTPGITGAAIANAVIERLRTLTELAPVLNTVVEPLRGRLSLLCGITVLAPTPAATAQPTQQGSAPVEDQPSTPAPAAAPADPATDPVIVLPGFPASGGNPVDPGTEGAGAASQGSAPSAVEPGGLIMSVTSMAVAEAPVEPRRISWPAVLATLMILLVSTHLGRVWVLGQPDGRRAAAGQVGSSGRSARPLDPTARP